MSLRVAPLSIEQARVPIFRGGESTFTEGSRICKTLGFLDALYVEHGHRIHCGYAKKKTVLTVFHKRVLRGEILAFAAGATYMAPLGTMSGQKSPAPPQTF
jgi:hypothetical protein